MAWSERLRELGIELPTSNPELTPEFYGFSEADLDRPIFLDGVLGFQTGSIRQPDPKASTRKQ